MSKTSNKQRTIAKKVSLQGVGLHTGENVTMSFLPADENHGFAFKRIDLEGEPIIEADANYVVNTQRGTNLEKNGVKIHTSEHVLAALVGLDIDNVLIELDAPEPPIMDGSSKFFVEALEEADRGKRLRGASTLTQQTAKNLFLWPNRDLARKLFEMGIALLLELIWDKHRILEVYLNIAEFGPGV